MEHLLLGHMLQLVKDIGLQCGDLQEVDKPAQE